MQKLTVKEKIFYGLICNEERVYKHWYTRFLVAGVDLDRIRRVVRRIKNWYHWCSEWSKEGEIVANNAQIALDEGNLFLARRLFQEATGCYHIAQHFFYIDPEQKNKALEKVWQNFSKHMELIPTDERPLRIGVPFRGKKIPAYMQIQKQANKPLIILINGMDNLKEIEEYQVSKLLFEAGFNTLFFDGPGQGEMWQDMEFIPDYEKSVNTIIDWLEINYKEKINLKKIGTLGFSLGGYLSPLAAGYDKRISCAIGVGGPATSALLPSENMLVPIIKRGFMYITKTNTYKEAKIKFNCDIKKVPPMDRPLLIVHSGADVLIPDGQKHLNYFIDWAIGEKEAKFYPDGEHICANYLDELFPYVVDWFMKKLL